MTRILALEWDAREIRAASATKRGNDVVVEQAFAIARDERPADDPAGDDDIGPMVSAALAERGISHVSTLVGVGRASIELRVMTLPPAPLEEQPDLVRYQAAQAFAAIGEDWPLDFVAIETHEDSVKVLAATVAPKLIQQIEKICQQGGLTPQRLLLRPFAAASLLKRSNLLPESTCCLMVDLLADEADLTVLSEGQVVFMRTVRLPAGNQVKVQASAVLGELRRTIGAAQNQLGGRRVEQVVICGGAEEHTTFADTVADTLSLPVVMFDPFDVMKMRRGLKKHQPENSARFAPLFGMLADEGAGAAHAIDFLNPRKRPTAPSHRGRNVGLAVAATVILVAGCFTVWYQLRSLDQEIQRLLVASDQMDTAVEKAETLIAKVNAIREFEDGDITWLDELSEVAKRLPDADHTILSELTVGANTPRGGIMTLKGNVVESSLIAEFEESLRYGQNVVSGRQGTVDPSRQDYPWLLDTAVIVEPDLHEQGRSLGRPPIKQRVPETDSETEQTEPGSNQPERLAESPAESSEPTGSSEQTGGAQL